MSVTRYCQAGHKFIIDGTMAEGETITVTVEPADGYSFSSWDDGILDNPRQIYIDSCGEVFTARFTSSGPGPTPTPTTHRITITVCPNGYGTFTGNGVYNHGDIAHIKVIPAPGHENDFVSWSHGPTPNSLEQDVEVTGDLTYTARFIGCGDFVWTATMQPNVSCIGNVQPETQTVHRGGTATVTCTWNEGYAFGDWWSSTMTHTSGTITGHTSVLQDTNVQAGVNLTAKIKAVIKVEAGTGGTAEIVGVSGNQSIYDYPTNNIQLKANPSSGYTFDHWTFNGNTINGGATLTRNYSGNSSSTCVGGTYKAYFTQSAPTQTTYYWKSADTLDGLRVPLTQYNQATYTSTPATLNLGSDSTDGRFKHWTAIVVPSGRSASCIWLDGLNGEDSFQLTTSKGYLPTDGTLDGYTCLSGKTHALSTEGYSSAIFTIQ